MGEYELFNKLKSIEYIPFTISNHKQLLYKTIYKIGDNDVNYLIIAINKEGVILYNEYELITYSELFQLYRFQNGGIVGKKTNKKYGKR